MEFTFLISSERSGSNLLTKMMDNHPLYCGPSPVHIFRLILENRLSYGDLKNLKNWDMLLTDVGDLLETQLGVWKTEWNIDQLSRLVPKGDLAALFRTIFEKEAVANGKKRIFVKENHLYRYIEFILANFPDSKFVYLVRDPRDMALSWKKSPVLRGAVVRASNVWKIDQAESIKVYSLLLDVGKIICIRYEELLRNPEEELSKLCSFLDIPYHKSMLNFPQNGFTAINAQRSSAWENLSKPLLTDNFNKFQKELSIDEIKYIEALCKEEMELLGYQRVFSIDETVETLENRIIPLEKYEKEAFRELSREQRDRFRRNHEVMKRIQQRSPQPLMSTYLINTSGELQIENE
ncbi:MAG: sulfotransferase [Calditrichaeota bacterium]|nr:MAG: sulfotransferase [Calditrichota bacterium]